MASFEEQHNAYQGSLDTVRTIVTTVSVLNRRGSTGSIADRAVKTANLLKEGFVLGNTVSFGEGNTTIIVDTLHRAPEQAKTDGSEELVTHDGSETRIFTEEAMRHAMTSSARNNITVGDAVQRALKIADTLDNLTETGHTIGAINANGEITGTISFSVFPRTQ